MFRSLRSSNDWWARKVRQLGTHLQARVRPEEREELAGWVTPGSLALFDAMPVADQRHGLDVVASLRRAGYGADGELLAAGLLHDAGKGPRVRLWHRIAWSLGERYGGWVLTLARLGPGGREAFARLVHHAELSADLARAAGASQRTVALIRHQARPVEAGAGEALRRADEAS